MPRAVNAPFPMCAAMALRAKKGRSHSNFIHRARASMRFSLAMGARAFFNRVGVRGKSRMIQSFKKKAIIRVFVFTALAFYIGHVKQGFCPFYSSRMNLAGKTVVSIRPVTKRLRRFGASAQQCGEELDNLQKKIGCSYNSRKSDSEHKEPVQRAPANLHQSTYRSYNSRKSLSTRPTMVTTGNFFFFCHFIRFAIAK